METPNEYLKLRKVVPFSEVSFGHMSVYLYLTTELEKAQLGYSISEGGESLTGETEGYWREFWLVIGFEDECGDPIFIDTHSSHFPVYTAIHGQGKWEPKKVAISFSNFVKSLEYIKKISGGRKNPTELENKPLSSGEVEKILQLISQENKGISMVFWETWLKDEC